jgi:class 3 adenylate cyclase/tetratricopeptide (TPR) repeat protein
VTVLFADVAGSTGLGEQLDPERLKDVMDSFLQAMRAELEAEGGTVEKFIGDAVMAVFGAPVAHEDDPTRALRAALRMRQALDGLNRSLEEIHGVRLAMRIGVNTGEVVARTAPRLGEGFVTGDAVNVAARLEQRAESGQILVGERTARAARGLSLKEIGPLSLKGKEEPVRTYELLEDVVAEPGAVRRAEPGLHRTPMVGRDRELALLQSVFERSVKERRPHLVTIYGEAGVGKTRLVEEFATWTVDLAEPPLVISGRCLPYGEGVTYWPLAEILKGLAGVLDSDASDVALARIHRAADSILRAVPGQASDAARTTAALAFTVGLQDPAYPVGQADPREVRAATNEAWRVYFSALSRQRPLVVVVEDIHWADMALLDLLKELADHSEGSLLFVCPARPELTARRPDWGGGRWNYSSLLLEPLPTPGAEELLDLLVAGEELSASLRSRILERAGGNPFFLEEIVQRLLDERSSVAEEAGWLAASEIEDVDIPDTVQGVLAARMDLLPPLEKRVLQSASAVGRTFWNGAVESLLEPAPPPRELDEMLSRLEDRGLVHARIGSIIVGQREFSFRHVLTQEVAYESLPRRERALAHARVADWIEGQTGERRREFAELLAHHYEEAHRGFQVDVRPEPGESERLRGRAFQFSLIAANEARSKLALQQAERFAETALSLASGPSERSDALEALGMSYFHDYRGDLAWHCLKEAIDLRTAEVDRTGEGSSRALARLCAGALEIVSRIRGTMRHRITRSEADRYLALGLAHAGDGDSEERARLLVDQSFWPYAFREQDLGEEALAHARKRGEEAEAIAERLGRPDLQSAALDGITSSFHLQGRYAPMEGPVRRRLELASHLSDPYEVGDIHAMAAWWALNSGRYRDAWHLADEGFRRSISGSLVSGLYCLDFRTVASLRLSDWEAALDDVALAEQYMGDRRETPPGFAAMHLAAAAFIYDARGDQGASNRYLQLLTWLEHAEDRPDTSWMMWRARLFARRGDFEAARALLERPDVANHEQGRDEVLEAWCEVVGEEGAWKEAPSVAEAAQRHARWAGLPPLELYGKRLEGRAALAEGDPDRAREMLAEAAGGFDRLEARWEAAVTRIDLAAATEALGRTQETRALVDGVVPVFDGLRSLRELVLAGDILARLT